MVGAVRCSTCQHGQCPIPFLQQLPSPRLPQFPQSATKQALPYLLLLLPTDCPLSTITLSIVPVKHILLSHCFFLWDLPTHSTAFVNSQLHYRRSFLLEVYKTATNLLIGTTGTHQRCPGRSRACLQANSWPTGCAGLLTHIISVKTSSNKMIL